MVGILMGSVLSLYVTNTRLNEFIGVQHDLIQWQAEIIDSTYGDIINMQKYNIPYQYLTVLKDECTARGVDIDFMIRMMYVESRYDPAARSSRGAHGLMQLQYPTARDMDPKLTSFWQLYDPETNIHLGVKYFAMLLDRYGGDYQRAAIAYNRGPTRSEREWLNGMNNTEYYDLIQGVGVVN